MIRFLHVLIDWLLWQFGFTGDPSRIKFNESDVPFIAVAILRTSWCTAHTGICFRTNAGLRFLHFGNHDETLRNSPCYADCAYAVPMLLEEDGKWLAGFCARIHRANQSRKLPYSFEFDPNVEFNPRSGLVAINRDSGLTCATFVVAVFRSADVPIVEPRTWPRQAFPIDFAARQQLLNHWRTSGRLRLVARAREIETCIQTMRIRPEQVAGACLQLSIPTGFYRAAANGKFLLDRIAERFGG